MKKIFIYITLSMSILSCTEFVDLEELHLNPSIVINSIITPDSLITVELFKTVNINQYHVPPVKDATIKLFENDIEVEQLSHRFSIRENPYYKEEGGQQFDTTFYYTSTTTTAKQNSSYKLVVSHPDLGIASCETTIPKPVKIMKIDTSRFYSFEKYLEELIFNFDINFKDPNETKNYYRIVLLYQKGTLETDTTGVYPTEFIKIGKTKITLANSNDILINKELKDANSYILGSPWNTYRIFNDNTINGKKYILSVFRDYSYIIDCDSYCQQDLKLKPGEFYKFTLQLHSLSSEIYNYLKSENDQSYYNDDPFVEPVQVYSNIKNGIGIFGSYSKSSYEVTFGDYPIEGIEYRYTE